MNGKVLVQELQAVNFTRKDLVPEELNIATLTTIMPEQMINKKQNFSTWSRVKRSGQTLTIHLLNGKNSYWILQAQSNCYVWRQILKIRGRTDMYV